MEVVQIKNSWKVVKFHARIAWRGFCRALYGAAVAVLIGMAVCGFASIPSEDGWVAVFDFIASCATATVALSNMYLIGFNKKGEKHG